MALEVGSAVAVLVAEATLQLAVQKALADRTIDYDEKRERVVDAIKERLAADMEEHGRLFFGWDEDHWKGCILTSSVAIEETHSCYLSHCDLQKGGFREGCLFVVYGLRGMGKSTSALSLLIHRHGRAPKRGMFFGGKTYFRNGNEYFNFIIDQFGGNQKLQRLSKLDVFIPQFFSEELLRVMPVRWADLDDPIKTGVEEIPGLRDFLKNSENERKFGGTPLLVFEDVNINITPRNKEYNKEKQRETWYDELGNAADFFDNLITMAQRRGHVIFVTTNSLSVAQFFDLLNGREKAKPFKPVTDEDKFSCQFFSWTEDTRYKFLKLQNEASVIKLPDDLLKGIAATCDANGESIREMHAGYVRERSLVRFPQYPLGSTSGEPSGRNDNDTEDCACGVLQSIKDTLGSF